MRCRTALLATIALAAPALLHAQPQADQAALEQRFDAEINPDEIGGWLKQMASEPNQVGSAHDKANAEFELHLFQQWGWDAHIETFQVLYPTPLSEVLETTAPHPVPRHFAGTRRPRRRHLRPDAGRTARLPCLPGRRRRHRPARLRQLRHAGRLQAARTAGRGRARQDRHHPLRPRLARPEAETGAGPRCHRLHHLFRPRAGRLQRGSCLPERPGAAAAGHPARLGGRHAALPRRPANPRRGCHRRGPIGSTAPTRRSS